MKPVKAFTVAAALLSAFGHPVHAADMTNKPYCLAAGDPFIAAVDPSTIRGNAGFVSGNPLLGTLPETVQKGILCGMVVSGTEMYQGDFTAPQTRKISERVKGESSFSPEHRQFADGFFAAAKAVEGVLRQEWSPGNNGSFSTPGNLGYEASGNPSFDSPLKKLSDSYKLAR